MPTTLPLTAADVERLGAAGERMELIDGVLREKEGVSLNHGEIEFEIGGPLHAHVKRNGLGRVYPSDTQFRIFTDPDVIRIPDLAFVRTDRLPPKADRWHIAPFAPDLAVAVVSPTDRFDDVAEKIAQYQRAGVPLIWLVVPRQRTVIVYRLGEPQVTLHDGDVLDGGEVIPGFRLPVADIFQ